MTIEELEDTLPNGFHDSCLVSVSVDFLTAACVWFLMWILITLTLSRPIGE